MKSIIQNEKYCYKCLSRENLHLHHIFHGTANRSVSDKNGFTCYLCAYHHKFGGKDCVHENRDFDLSLKQQCQKEFEETHNREEFIKIIGKNYLD